MIVESQVVVSKNVANFDATTSTTIAVTFTPGTGEIYVVWVTWDSATLGTVTCADNQGGSYAQKRVVNNTTHGQAWASFVNQRASKSGVSTTVTCTFNAARNFRAIVVARVPGAVGRNLGDGENGATFDAPTTATDAVTSGNMTNTSQPGIIVALANDISNATIPALGTNFVTSVDTDATLGTLVEVRRITSTSSTQVATATAQANNAHTIDAVILDEAAAREAPVPYPPFFRFGGGQLPFLFAKPAAYTSASGSAVVPLAETLSLTEALAIKFAAKATGLAETESLTESETSILHAKAALSETLSVAESLATVFRAVAALAETVSTSESLLVSKRYFAQLSESVAVAESLAAKLGAIAALAESSSAAEALAAKLAALATLSESAALAESLAARLKAIAALSEAEAVAEAVASRLAARATLAESEALAEQLAASRGVHVPLSESAALAEAVGALYRARPALSEAVIFLEAFSGPGSISVSEGVSLAEQLQVRARALVALQEAGSVGEQLAALARLHLALAEGAALAEALFVSGGPVGPQMFLELGGRWSSRARMAASGTGAVVAPSRTGARMKLGS